MDRDQERIVKQWLILIPLSLLATLSMIIAIGFFNDSNFYQTTLWIVISVIFLVPTKHFRVIFIIPRYVLLLILLVLSFMLPT